jgi:hypothetical protein
MAELIVALLTWIAAETALVMPPPPHAVLVAEDEMTEQAARHIDVMGFYDRDTTTVYLRADWDPADLRSRATLLHELVHHVQSFNRVPSRCAAEQEILAYELTVKWLRQQGVADPYKVLDTDEFTIIFFSMCPEG